MVEIINPSRGPTCIQMGRIPMKDPGSWKIAFSGLESVFSPAVVLERFGAFVEQPIHEICWTLKNSSTQEMNKLSNVEL
jgi:hypothetical protein